MFHLMKRYMSKGSFSRNVGLLTGGTIFAQGVLALSLPFLTRLYTPEDFSMLAVYSSIVGMFTVVSCLRFNIAIPMSQEDDEAMNLLVLSLLSTGCVFLLLLIPVFFLSNFTSQIIGQPNFQPYLWMVPFGLFFASSYDALQYWASRKKRFWTITKTRITRALSGVGAQLGIGLANPIFFGLIFGQLLYFGAGVIGLMYSIWKHDRRSLRAFSPALLKKTAVDYKRFPLFSVPEALSNTAAIEIPILLIAAMGPTPEAGFLMLSMRVMGIPMTLIGGSVAQVFLAEAGDRLRNGTARDFTLKMMWTLLKIGAPVLVIAGVLAPFLFPVIFGEEWARAGIIVSWATPWYILQFVSSPVSMIFHVAGQTVKAMWLQIFGSIFRISVVLISITWTQNFTVEAFAISGAVFYLIYIVLLLQSLNKLHPTKSTQ